MKALVKILEKLGCERIRTYIQSGNVVFYSTELDRDRLAQAVRSRIQDAFQFDPAVFLLEVEELREAIVGNPFCTQDGRALHFYFLESRPREPDLEALNCVKSDSEEFWLSGKLFYLYAPDGVGRSKLASRVERCLGVTATARNWNTVCKLMDVAQLGA